MKRLVLSLIIFCGCKIERQPPGSAFADSFDAPTIGAAWKTTPGGEKNYRIENGEIVAQGALNHPLWLSTPIPKDAIIELDCWSNSDVGDIKVEAWGDGESYAKTLSYTATSYVFVFGGWHNQISAIARLNEHGSDRRTRSNFHVEKGQKYHFRIERNGGHIDWQVDGKPFLTFDDPKPLAGPSHAYLALNDWEAEIHFDNLSVKPR